ncbi:hypothetical protein J4410_04950 [Candidatus Woesearchaeota archaeon]|nr:hypothetical protein [Candidatus Woesearchaeota archaeon]
MKGCEKVGDQEHRMITEEEFPQNREAAECCPVNVIHIIDKDTGEKLI